MSNPLCILHHKRWSPDNIPSRDHGKTRSRVRSAEWNPRTALSNQTERAQNAWTRKAPKHGDIDLREITILISDIPPNLQRLHMATTVKNYDKSTFRCLMSACNSLKIVYKCTVPLLTSRWILYAQFYLKSLKEKEISLVRNITTFEKDVLRWLSIWKLFWGSVGPLTSFFFYPVLEVKIVMEREHRVDRPSEHGRRV